MQSFRASEFVSTLMAVLDSGRRPAKARAPEDCLDGDWELAAPFLTTGIPSGSNTRSFPIASNCDDSWIRARPSASDTSFREGTLNGIFADISCAAWFNGDLEVVESPVDSWSLNAARENHRWREGHWYNYENSLWHHRKFSQLTVRS